MSGRAAGSTEILLTHMRHPFLGDGHLESLKLVARMLTFEFLPSFSWGALGGVMEPLWDSFLCDIETSPVTAAHNGVQLSSSSPAGKHLLRLMVPPALLRAGRDPMSTRGKMIPRFSEHGVCHTRHQALPEA